MKKKLLLVVFLMFAFLLQAQTHEFLNINGDGNWHNPANWSDNSVPDASSTVVIPDGFEAIVAAQNAFANSIELEGAAILELNNVLHLTNTLNISPVGNLKLKNGSINGGVLNNQGFIRVTELTQKQLTQVTINNSRSIILENTGFLNLSQVIINNELGATFEIIGRSGLLNNNIDSQFNNIGLFKKSFDGASPSFSYLVLEFTNEGTIDIDGGEQLLFLGLDVLLNNTSNGTIQGTGILDITGTFINDGTISPGGDEVGTIDFVNVFAASSSSTLRIDIDTTTGENDLIRFIGSGSISGNIFIPPIDGPFEVGEQFTVFTAQLGLDSCTLPDQVYEDPGFINDIVFNVLCQPNSVVLEAETIVLNTALNDTSILFSLTKNLVSSTAEILVSSNLISKNSILSISDVTGKQLQNVRILAEITTLNTDSWAEGMYFITLVGDDKKQTVKLLVQR
jgi:hypothetical protein